MPPINLDDSFNAAVIDSFNETENNLDVEVGVEDSFNEDNSEDNSTDVDVVVDGSFNEDSHDTDIDITDSWNTYTDESVNDNSVNAGVREYNTGLGDIAFGGSAAAAGHGGSVHIVSHSTVLDQSVNQNIASLGDVNQAFVNSSVVSTGEGSTAIGGDYTSSIEIDESTNLSATDGGAINIGNETNIDFAFNSGNEFLDESVTEDNSIDVDIEDSGNDYSDNFDFEDSFNEETTTETAFDVDADINAIVDSEDSAILGDLELGL